MLKAGRSKAVGRAITLITMDGQGLACRHQAFDAVVCQLGLMFFPEARRGLEEFRRVLCPGGRAAVCVWSKPERVPLIGILADALSRQLPAQREELHMGFSLGDADLLERLFTQARFKDICVTLETREIVFESFDDYWEPVEAGGARLGKAYRELPEDARRTVAQEVHRRLSQFESNGRLVMKVEALLAAASA